MVQFFFLTKNRLIKRKKFKKYQYFTISVFSVLWTSQVKEKSNEKLKNAKMHLTSHKIDLIALITNSSIHKIHLRLNSIKNAINLFLENIFMLKKSILCSKRSKNINFYLHWGQIYKMQKSAKGLKWFFCYLHMSPWL